MQSRLVFSLLLLIPLTASAQSTMVLKANMEALQCKPPEAKYRFIGSNAPGQVFFADEPVNLQFVVQNGGKAEQAAWKLIIQEITTRDPERHIKTGEGFTDTSGHPPLLGTPGKPTEHAFKAALSDKPETEIEVANVPVPKRFGTYAIILNNGADKFFLATVARVPQPKAGGNLENTPIFGEYGLFDKPELYEQRAAATARMGVHGLRMEVGWSPNKDFQYDWDRLDKSFAACEKHGIQLMVTIGAHNGTVWPFGPAKQTPASVGPQWDGNPYWGQADWLCDPKHYPKFGEWVEQLCRRYWKDGKGALWGLENFNEPWEGGGISGWARDAEQYRLIHKAIATNAWKVDRKIKICAASSIMNTEDKLFGDGTKEFDQYIDVFTDHYVVPPMAYGPMVAKAHGKYSVETETWFVGTEYLLPHIVQFLAAGQKRLSPWHQRVLFDTVAGSQDQYLIPTPIVAASAAFNRFTTGKDFEKVVFGIAAPTAAAPVGGAKYEGHLPWLFQFGKDNDPEGTLVFLGKLMTIGGNNPKERLWSQVDAAPGGFIVIDNADGLLQFFDLAGNPSFVGEKQVKLPLTIEPAYIACAKGPAAAAERIRTAKIEEKQPVEIIPRDFAFKPSAAGGHKLAVDIHNCLNRAISAELTVETPAGVKLKSGKEKLSLGAGMRQTIQLPIESFTANPTNAYLCKFKVVSDGGNAEWSEVLHATVAVKGTKTIDGKLDDWKDVPGVSSVAGIQEAELTELLRRPWLDLKQQRPDGNQAEFKVAWDENFLYFAARVNDKTAQNNSPAMAGRDENAYFHTAASDAKEPYKSFLKDFPKRSFSEVPFVYADSPEKPRNPNLPDIHFRRDRLHIALDVVDDWHDFTPTTNQVPRGFHAIPDTDYEYACYPCRGETSETWRLLAPGCVRRHDFPRTGSPANGTGPVAGAKHVVRREGNEYVYELAIPKEELTKLKLAAGTSFGMMLRAGNGDGPHVDFGDAKASTKQNGLTLHPYWERSTDCGVQWTLVE